MSDRQPLLFIIKVKYCFYRRAKQHIRPVLPRNQQAPMKRKSATIALAHSRAWKKRDVRSVAEFCTID